MIPTGKKVQLRTPFFQMEMGMTSKRRYERGGALSDKWKNACERKEEGGKKKRGEDLQKDIPSLILAEAGRERKRRLTWMYKNPNHPTRIVHLNFTKRLGG